MLHVFRRLSKREWDPQAHEDWAARNNHGRASKARKLAIATLGQTVKGDDPAEQHTSRRNAITIKALSERYLAAADKGLILGKGNRPKKANSLYVDRGRIARHIVPLLGSKKIQDPKPADINRFIADVASGKTSTVQKTAKKRGKAVVKGGLGTAARTVGLLGGMLTYAVEHGIIEQNVVHGIRKPADRVKDRRLSEDEYRLLGKILGDNSTDERFRTTVEIIRVGRRTFQRGPDRPIAQAGLRPGLNLKLGPMGAIRILLALSVVLWHVRGYHLRLLNASVAVLLFFVISGFYMALVINEKYAPSGPQWIRRFYLARFLRLYPLYAAMCAFMVFWYWWTGNPNVVTSRLPVTAGEQVALVLLNIGVFGQDLYELMNHIGGEPVRSLFSKGFFNDGYMLVGQAWSLSPEIFFYSLAPLVVRSPARIMALLVASLSIRFAFVAAGWTSRFWGYWFFPSTMCLFALGSLSYFLYRRVRNWRWSGPVGWCALAGMVAWMLTLSVMYGVALPVDATQSLDQPRFWLVYLTFAALLPFVFCATRAAAIDRLVGDLSYPLYLVHGVVLGVIWNWVGRPMDSIVFVVAAVAASILAAVVLRCAVELPAERRFNGAAVRA